MLILKKNSAENVVCTVTDAITVSQSVYYLFVLSSKTVGNKEFLFFSTDISPFPNRYNEFVITEGENKDFYAPVGDYYYKVIQKLDQTPTYTSSDPVLEEGIVRLTAEVPTTTGSYSYLKNYGAKK